MRLQILGVLLLGLSLALSGCGYRKDEMRYRMTVEVETPAGPREGSAVREVIYTVPPNLPLIGESRPQWGLEGEAVAVDLPNGEVLFALLTGEGNDNLQPHLGISTLFRERGTRMRRALELYPANARTSRPTFETLRPMLVTFGDLADPTSVALVDPDDLAASFGKGYVLRRITVQITDDPVTTGIGERLAWLSEYPEPHLNPEHGPKDFSLPAILSHGDFRKGGGL